MRQRTEPRRRLVRKAANEVAAGGPTGTAGVRRLRAARTRRRSTTKKKDGRRRTGTAKEGPKVLCQLMGAQAGHHQLMSVVPTADGEDLANWETK